VSCTLDCINPSLLSAADLSTRLATLLALVVQANSTHAKNVYLQTFTSVQALFERFPAGISVSDPKTKQALENLFFDPSYEGLSEAMRMKRAEALVAVSKVSGCEWVVERVRVEVEGGERSPVVRAVLAKAGKE